MNNSNKENIQNSFQDELKLTSVITENKKKCRCGHTQFIPRSRKYEWIICTHCNGRLYWDDLKQIKYNKKRDRDEFIFQLRKCILGNEKEVVKNDRYKRRYFKTSKQYFKFLKTHPEYRVECVRFTKTNIVVIYSKKLGRPKKKEIKIVPTFVGFRPLKVKLK